MFKDYYSILGVQPNACAEQIRGAFKQLALRCHPDKLGSTIHSDAAAIRDGTNPMNQTNGSAVAEFTEVQEAYEVLGDVARRYLYDLNYEELVTQQRRMYQESMKQQQYQQQRARERERLAREQAELEREAERARVKQQLMEAAMHNSKQQQQQSAPDDGEGRSAFDMTHGGEEEAKRRRQAAAAAAQSEKPAARVRPAARKPLPLPPTPCIDGAASTENSAAASPVNMTSSSPTTSGEKRPRKKRVVPPRPAPSPAPPPSRNSTHSSQSLPPLSVASGVSIAFEDLDAAAASRRPKQRYPLPSPESQGLPQDYYYQKAISRTLSVFFSKEIANMREVH